MSNQILKNITATVDETKIEAQTPAPESGIDSVVDNLISQAPQVQEHVIEHFENAQKAENAEISNLTDRFGVSFDPAIHITGRDGKPTVTKTGKLMRKGGTSPVGAKATTQKQKPAENTGAKSFVGSDAGGKIDPPQAELKVEHKASGIALAGAIMALSVAIGGEEFNPLKRDDLGLDERAMLENASAEWLRAKNMTDLPPDVAFAIAIASYIVPRFTMPKTQNRIKLFFQWIGAKFVAWKSRRGLNLAAKTS